MLFIMLVGLTLFDLFHSSTVVIYVGGSLRIIAWMLLCFCNWNRFYKNRFFGIGNEYKVIASVVIIGMLGSCICFIGRVVLMTCEHEMEHYIEKSGAEQYSMLMCNPLKGTGLLPSYFYILVSAVYIAQLTLNYQDFIGLAIAWGLVLVTLIWIQAVNGFFIMVVDDCIVASFIFCSFASAIKNRERFFLIRAKLKAEIATLKVEATSMTMEVRLKDMRDLIGNVSHDLKTPIHAFSMELDSLHQCLEEESTEDMNKKAMMISSVVSLKDTSAFMLMTINRCLDFTKANSGMALIPQRRTISLYDSLAWAVGCVQRSREGGAVLILDEIPQNVCTHIITDYQWLVENILCLSSNAVKHTMTGSIHVRCHLTKDKNWLRVEVEDTGIGISEDARSSLFQPFMQAQKMAGGTGLGLYSMLKRVEALHGSCGIDDRNDGFPGTLFWFQIPYVPDRTASESQDSTPSTVRDAMNHLSTRHNDNNHTLHSNNSNISTDNIKLLTILLVEDSLVIQKTTKRILVKQGYAVDVASNGLLGLNMLIEKRYHLVLMGKVQPSVHTMVALNITVSDTSQSLNTQDIYCHNYKFLILH
jgi:signal transduction histidine kinase